MAKRNILLMIADDLGKQLGCYGNSKIQTPNLDQLAAEGTRFDQAFTSTASCSASRSVIYTGLHTHQNGQYGLHNGRHHFTTFDHVETAPGLFSQHGYMTGLIGKVHVGPSSVYPWDMRAESDSRDIAAVADQASSFFKSCKEDEKPFFLTIGYIDPHRDLTRSGFGNTEEYDPRVKKIVYDRADVEVEPFVNDLPGVRFEFAEYYQSISRLDQGVGMVLDELSTHGLTDDTLIIFMSDNGPPFINSKTTLYDAGVCLPLLMKCPGSPSGIKNPNMVSYIDILPTLLDWTSHPASKPKDPHPTRTGRSLLPILSETQAQESWSKVFGSHTFHEITNYWPTRFMRSKMIGSRPLKDYFFRPAEELYDLSMDPHEVRNLAADEAYISVLEEMRCEMEKWQRRTEDPWLYRDGVSMLLVRHHLEAGLEVPDRFDFDENVPHSEGLAHFDAKAAWGFEVEKE
ncbi:Alkaline phosphatase-like alpha/beta/alpha [Penicillium hetheringtonii]|uniref:Alkaline phosphatase-like alpha/beta/alpha n=1 Tax=Penicillium hetheringtonii TaxID=911720 RepID=A0AAD6DPV3_9EURO|nr:Alkaline phosphatase-like alpha/beta/alpha [Penicillium hetheringtonii]